MFVQVLIFFWRIWPFSFLDGFLSPSRLDKTLGQPGSPHCVWVNKTNSLPPPPFPRSSEEVLKEERVPPSPFPTFQSIFVAVETRRRLCLCRDLNVAPPLRLQDTDAYGPAKRFGKSTTSKITFHDLQFHP